VASYELCADEYAQSTSGEPPEDQSRLFPAFVQQVGRGGRVLEIGSGPGWDADRLEATGIEVERTDVAQAFIDFQGKRGKRIARLDVIDDDIAGTYDGILCLYVLQHVARPLIDTVLEKMSAALKSGGVLLVALRQGNGELREIGDTSGATYHITLWPQRAFIERLGAAGLSSEQFYTFSGRDGEWLTVLARKD
jgi:SAM-dependent methyltransferase